MRNRGEKSGIPGCLARMEIPSRERLELIANRDVVAEWGCVMHDDIEHLREAVVNDICPISGDRVDKATLPMNRIRQFKGRTIGFCSVECPEEWDELSDTEREEKLFEAIESGAR